jgi:peptide/nickel transport system permease protein
MQYDYPTVMGVGIISVFLTLLGILISDILYAAIDPRIRYE